MEIHPAGRVRSTGVEQAAPAHIVAPQAALGRVEEDSCFEVESGSLPHDIAQQVGSEDWQVRLAAIELLKEAGPEALPHLNTLMKSEEWFVRLPAVQALAHRGHEALPLLVAQLQDADPVVKQSARDALFSLHPLPVEELLRHFSAEECLNYALGHAGPEVLPFFEKALLDLLRPLSPHHASARQLRERAAAGLKGRGLAALPLLAKAIDDPDPYIRRCAVRSLSGMGPEALPLLSKAIRDSESFVRQEACKILGELGPPALPLLQLLLTPSFATSDRLMVTHTAMGMGVGPAALPLFSKAIQDEDLDIRRTGINACRAMGAEALPALKPALSHPTCWETRLAAVEALCEKGPEVLPFLHEATEDASLGVKLAAWKLLAQEAKPFPVERFEAFFDKLRTYSRDRRMAVECLTEVGPEAVPLLAKIIRDPDDSSEVRAAAVFCLKNKGREAFKVVSQARRSKSLAYEATRVHSNMKEHSFRSRMLKRLRGTKT